LEIVSSVVVAEALLKERARMKPMTKAFFVSEQRKQMHRSAWVLTISQRDVVTVLSTKPCFFNAYR
jgi:hypothetical protein